MDSVAHDGQPSGYLALGFADAWIRAIECGAPTGLAELDDADRAVQVLTLAVLDRQGHRVRAELEAVGSRA